MSSRWFRFILVILIGIGLGLLYAWVISPVDYVDTVPNALRVDYRTDYVLMVAETFHADRDLPLAVRRLGFLGSDPPAQIALQAIQFAEEQHTKRNLYADSDLVLLRGLLDAMQPLVQTP